MKTLKSKMIRIDQLTNPAHYTVPSFVDAMVRVLNGQAPTEADCAPRADTVRVQWVDDDGREAPAEDLSLMMWHRVQYQRHCDLHPHEQASNKRRFERIVNDRISLWDEIQEFCKT